MKSFDNLLVYLNKIIISLIAWYGIRSLVLNRLLFFHKNRTFERTNYSSPRVELSNESSEWKTLTTCQSNWIRLLLNSSQDMVSGAWFFSSWTDYCSSVRVGILNPENLCRNIKILTRYGFQSSPFWKDRCCFSLDSSIRGIPSKDTT